MVYSHQHWGNCGYLLPAFHSIYTLLKNYTSNVWIHLIQKCVYKHYRENRSAFWHPSMWTYSLPQRHLYGFGRYLNVVLFCHTYLHYHAPLPISHFHWHLVSEIYLYFYNWFIFFVLAVFYHMHVSLIYSFHFWWSCKSFPMSHCSKCY